jgi:hypothetical protein
MICSLDNRGSIPEEVRDFSLVHSVQTAYGVHTTPPPYTEYGGALSGFSMLAYVVDF